LVVVNGGEPEAELVGKIVARAPGAVALDEGRGAEVLQARAGRAERLAAALGARRRVHGEAVADPQRVPPRGALGHQQRLRVHRDHVRRHLAHGTPAPRFLCAIFGNGCTKYFKKLQLIN